MLSSGLPPAPLTDSAGAILERYVYNGCAESFHSRFRDEFLALEVFDSLAAAGRLTAIWKEDYNHVRPHSSLGYVPPPARHAALCAAPRIATLSSPQHTEITQPQPS